MCAQERVVCLVHQASVEATRRVIRGERDVDTRRTGEEEERNVIVW